MDDEVSDTYLVRRAQEGYLDAYAELVERHGARAYRVALRMLGNHHDAQEVAQDALVAAWQQLPHFRGDASFTTWLYRIVTRRAVNHATRSKRTESLDLLGDRSDERADADPAYWAERDLTVDAVTDALARLPTSQRTVIVLHHFEGLTYDEVAEVIGSTEPSVRSHLYRARRTLTRTLAQWK